VARNDDEFNARDLGTIRDACHELGASIRRPIGPAIGLRCRRRWWRGCAFAPVRACTIVTFRVPIPEALLAGSDLVAGRYRLEKVLGMGGMGYVMSALHVVGPDETIERVAVKFMLPDAMKWASLHRRFVREAEAIGRLRSEHVCRLLDTGRLPDGAPFMVMEHLIGDDLDRLIFDRGPLPVWEAADYGLQVLEAIAEAHSQGIIHRDLKPANVFRAWTADGEAIIKVLDFGVAKAADGLHSTATDTMMGSPSFMAPEQIVSSKRVDERADIYSIGAILYFLLTGRAPYEAEQLPALCLKVMTEDPVPPSAHRPDLPPEVDDIVMTCMAREPTDRFPNAAELAHALLPFAPESSRPLAEAAFRSLGHTPGSWQRPAPTGGGRSAATVAFRRVGSGDGRATALVRFARAATPEERHGRRRRGWLVGGAVVACLALGMSGSLLLVDDWGGDGDLRGAASSGAPPVAGEPGARAPGAETTSVPAAAGAATASVPETSASAESTTVDGASGDDSPAAGDPAESSRAARGDAGEDSVDPAGTPEPVKSRRARRRRGRGAREREPASAPAGSESQKSPAEREPERRPAACDADDPLCAFGTAR
jgi:tRNA A-37 threonylcarbamoyl transferase component Bud32